MCGDDRGDHPHADACESAAPIGSIARDIQAFPWV